MKMLQPVRALWSCVIGLALTTLCVEAMSAEASAMDETDGGTVAADLHFVPFAHWPAFFGLRPGSRFTVTYFLRNAGPGIATNVALESEIPAGLRFVAITHSIGPVLTCTAPSVGSSGAIRCTSTQLSARTSAYFSLQLEVGDAPVDSLQRVDLRLSATQSDPNPDDNIFPIEVLVRSGSERADMSLVSMATPNAVAPGDELSYTFTVTNHGPDDAVFAGFTAVVPVGFRGGSATLPTGWTCVADYPPMIGPAPTRLHCRTPLMPIGSATTTFRRRVDVATRGTLSLTANANSFTADPDPTNNPQNVDVLIGFATPIGIPTLSSTWQILLVLLIVGLTMRATARDSTV